ncbi:MAG: creatininase family protein, partial [Gemmatimonadetes bacterium]|nr:creatininase family protein [Gemmatimonadota bacterium]
MNRALVVFAFLACGLLGVATPAQAQATSDPAPASDNGLPEVVKVRNYLPHMTRPEVEDLLTRSDMVLIPVASLEQHGTHLPIGTDYL